MSIPNGKNVYGYAEAYAKLASFGQQHLLKYYDELDEAQRAALLNQIEQIDFSVVSTNKQPEKRGRITPIGVTELAEIRTRGDEFFDAGMAELRAGHVGAVLLAGGMGTRLGSDAPKGAFNIGIKRELYIFECLINNLLNVTERVGSFVHLFIMTSDKNDAATRAFFAEHNYFGYAAEFVHFFTQETAPAADYDGKVYLEEKYRLATSPNGNGGWYSSMAKHGMLDIVRRNGIEWLNVFAVDNVLQRIADPLFIGATKLAHCEVGSKVIKKAAPDERVGVMCLEDGHPSIVEYYELTDEMRNAKNEKGEPAYNFGVILNYLFRVDALMHTLGSDFPLHIAHKKISHLNEAGELVKPEEPNGYKFETLVLDMVHMQDSCLAFEVDRSKEFAPVKNAVGVDSVETARALLEQNGVVL